MSGEVFSTTLAYTKSPKVTKRTTFQDELIKAITARSARQRSSEYSDDFDSDEIVSSGDYSDTSIDENSLKKTMNDFQISDDEENNSPKLSFLKTKKSNSDPMTEESSLSNKRDEEMAPGNCEDRVANFLSESQNEDQETEKEKLQMKPKPRILSLKNTSSAENSSSLKAENHFTPSPRPRSMLKKHRLQEEKDGLGEEKEAALREELEAHPAPPSLPEPNDSQPEAEEKTFSEDLDPEDPWLTSLSSSSLKESFGDFLSPVSGEKTSIKDQNEEFTENHHSLKSDKNEDNSLLIDFVTSALEKSKKGQVTSDDLEENKEKAKLVMSEDLTVDPPLSQQNLRSSSAIESAKKTPEDGNKKSKQSANNRASSASGRLMTSEFLKNSSSIRTPLKTTSSHYLGTLKVLDQKSSHKQNKEPNKADNIRAAVYQEWLEKKNLKIHEKHRIKRIESENSKIENEQKRAAKREEALASFEAWKAMKEKEAKKIAAKKRLEDKNKKKTEEESAVRKEAQHAFERWKEKKMEYLKEKNKKEKEYERAKKQKEEETIAEKKKDNQTAVEKWNEKKEAFFKEKGKEKISEKRKEELKRAEKRDKDKQAIDEYEKWLEKKERQERMERKVKKRHSFLEKEALPPWSPPSRTVFSKVI
ncbi:microtubule-associated protein 9 isoform X2 [Pipistrellus kuhlii]|uniref:microtubule-associated protein 9 isoform X2 n=1 Tax=Pipistrellus kuhlii TaxID=59472 RepID=UPI00174F1117|nr:microtubule-associated protein 9 isoform X2 [Pipistrellus kuhlii]